MPAGRPTSCTPDVIETALAYVSDNEEVNYKSYDHAIPSVIGLCRVINRGRSTVYQWADIDGHEFTDILASINEYQEFTVINGALKNELNANIAKLVLGKHGYSDKQELSGDPDKPVGIQQIVFKPVGNE